MSCLNMVIIIIIIIIIIIKYIWWRASYRWIVGADGHVEG